MILSKYRERFTFFRFTGIPAGPTSSKTGGSKTMSSALRNTAAGVVIAGGFFPASAAAQYAKDQGYLLDSQGNVVRAAGAGVCVRTSDWTPARAVAECDPDLVKKPAPPVKKAAPPPKKVEKKAPPKKKKPTMLNITEKIELQGM